MRRLILSTAFAVALVAITTDGFSQPPAAPPPAPAQPVPVQVFEYKQAPAAPAAAPQVIEFTGKINGDMNAKDARNAIRLMQQPNGASSGSIILQNTIGGLMNQGRGGPGGGGFGGGMPGGMRMMGGDPNQMFNMLSQGKEVINRNDLPAWQQQMFDRFAPQMGITNGQITRSQFQQAADMMRTRMQGGGGGPGGPGGGFGGQGGGMSPEQMDRFSEERFRRADTNGDGLLQVNEMSERLRPVWEKFDTNRDGAIDLNEFKSYMRSVFQENSSNAPAAQPPAAQPQVAPIPDSGSPSAEDDDRRPTVYRAGKLPKDIPAWFEQLDSDKDGQLGLYEWVNADRSIDEFRAMDRNEDGFLTIDEVMAYVRAKTNNSQGESLAAANPMNGFNGFGGGMQFSDNSQDNRGRPGRNRGGENGRGPGGIGRGPNGGNNANGRQDNTWFKGRGDNNGGNGNGFFGGFGGPGGRRGGDGNGFGGGPGGRRGGDNGFGRPDYGPNSTPANDNNAGRKPPQ